MNLKIKNNIQLYFCVQCDYIIVSLAESYYLLCLFFNIESGEN